MPSYRFGNSTSGGFCEFWPTGVRPCGNTITTMKQVDSGIHGSIAMRLCSECKPLQEAHHERLMELRRNG